MSNRAGDERPADQTERGLQLHQAATTLPALIAIAGGLLYATGALVRTAELRDAGMTVRDTITLVPIEQHLARGIAVALSPATLIVLAVMLLMGLGLHALFKRPRPDRKKITLTEPKGIALLAVLVLAVGAAIVVAPLGLLGALLGVGAGVLLVGSIEGVDRLRAADWTPSAVGFVSLLFVAIGVATVFWALLDPEPLPQVTAELEGGQTVRGGLIAHDGAHYYVATGEDRYTVVAEDRLVRPAQIKSRHLRDEDEADEQSLFELID